MEGTTLLLPIENLPQAQALESAVPPGTGAFFVFPALAVRATCCGKSGEMGKPSKTEITAWLVAWNEGDTTALEKLIPVVYDELRRLAHHYMNRERAGHTLQTTALVNEAYVRLSEMPGVQWQDRNHFFTISARLMRRILVDFARSRQSKKHGGKRIQISLDETLLST